MTNEDTTANNTTANAKTRVAVVGGGVAGLTCAWCLLESDGDDDHDVTVLEREARLGGHACTKTVDGVDVDVGFMVFNEENYPNMCAWFDRLGVEKERSDMSLSVSLDGGDGVEWCSRGGLRGLLANPWQAWTSDFWGFVRDLPRFHAEAASLLALDEDDPRRAADVGEWLRARGYSRGFARLYLLPMTAALWSASLAEVLRYPAAQLVAFLNNHRMLRLFDRPTWYTVRGRSRSYTGKMEKYLEAHPRGRAMLSTTVDRCASTTTTSGDGSRHRRHELFDESGASLGVYDHVVFACHPPTAGDVLERGGADSELVDLLRRVEYSDNVIYLHSDPRLMPRRRAAWASWNCMGRSALVDATLRDENHNNNEEEQEEERMKAVYVTYHLNRLQNLETDRDVFVSLNPHVPPEASLTHDRFVTAHPQFSRDALDARGAVRRRRRDDDDRLWFVGAWEGYGFHEDGCRSGAEAAAALSGRPAPWSLDGKAALPPPKEKAEAAPRPALGARSWRWLCRWAVARAFRRLVREGRLTLRERRGGDDGKEESSVVEVWGETDARRGKDVSIDVKDEQFYVDVATYGTEGLIGSFAAGHFTVRSSDTSSFVPVLGGDPRALSDLFALIAPSGLAAPRVALLDRLPIARRLLRRAARVAHRLVTDALHARTLRRALTEVDLGDGDDDHRVVFPNAVAFDTKTLAVSPADGWEDARAFRTECLLRRARTYDGARVLLIDADTEAADAEASRGRQVVVARSSELSALVGPFDRIVSFDATDARATTTAASAPPYDGARPPNPWSPSRFAALDALLARDGLLVAEVRVALRNKRVPGALPTVRSLVDDAYHGSTLTLERIDRLGRHSAEAARRRLDERRDGAGTIVDGVAARTRVAHDAHDVAVAEDDRAIGVHATVWCRPGCRATAGLNETGTLCPERAETWVS